MPFFIGEEGVWPAPGLTQQQKESLLAMIEKATSANEVDRLAKILETGEFPEEGLEGEEKKVQVKKDDGDTATAVKQTKMENGLSVASEMPADILSVSTPPAAHAEKLDNVDMEVTDDQNNEVEPKRKNLTPATTPTKVTSKRKGKEKGTPTRSPAKAGRGSEKEGNKEAAATKMPPPTPTGGSDDTGAQAMDTKGPEPPKPVLSEKEIKAMTVAILKKTLKSRNEPTTGLKKELQERLLVSCGHTT